MNSNSHEQYVMKQALESSAKKLKLIDRPKTIQDLKSINPKQPFPSFNILRVKNKPVIHVVDDKSKVILNNLADTIDKIYNLKQKNRNDIVSNIIQLLNENTEKYIYRLDIMKFFESIHPEYIYKNIESDINISPLNKQFIRNFLKNNEDLGIEGIGRGTKLNTTLSEYYLNDFDRKIKRQENLYFYARFVDDIVIFLDKYEPDFIERISKLLPVGLEFHKTSDKFSEVKCNNNAECKNFSYLGYRFYFNKKELINVDIAESKSNKIKKRMVKTLLDFQRNHNESILIKRLKYLSGNRFIKLNNGKMFSSGFYYTYNLINLEKSKEIKELDKFYRSILNTPNSKFNSIKNSPHLSFKSKRFIKNLSFKNSFESKPYYHIKDEDIKLIKRCWNHEK